MALLGQLSSGFGGRKLTRDIFYTLFSFAVLAASGLIINLVVTGLRDAAALGVFNQSYAIYILASQVAAFGLHYSIMRHAAVHDANPAERGQALGTAAAGALAGGALVGGLLYLGEPLLASLFDSDTTGRGIANAAFGLLLFPLNKVLLNYLNALRHMRAYSLLQSGRYITIMVLVSAAAATSLPIETAPLAFFAAEAVTTFAALAYLRGQGELRHWAYSRSWAGVHWRFGGKGLIAGMFAEFNSRIDVLIIGLFLSDRSVGIYSFAAMLADGLYQVLAMVRINFNPLLVRAMRDGDWAEASGLLRRSRRLLVPAMLVLSTLLVLAFWLLAARLLPGKGLMEGLPSLTILLSALVIVSSFVPFDNLLMVTGHPGYQTLQQLAMVSVNVAFGVLLLPSLGIEGVATGTALSYFAGATALVLMARRLIGWNLLANTFRN